MKRVILFRFHKNLKVCENRINLLKKYNPNVPIYGLFGGEDPNPFKKLDLKHIFSVKGKEKYWKWKNGDLLIRSWYKKVGRNLKFDMLHLVEWDLLLFNSLDKIYKKIPKNVVGVSALIKLNKVDPIWNWVTRNPEKTEWKNLLSYVKKKFKYNKEPYASLGPGTCLPKKFLEKYSRIKIPELAHDELRIPLFAQVFGFRLYDTKFYEGWFGKKLKGEKFFNCRNISIKISDIKKELSKKNGKRVFHPFRRIFN